MTRVGICLGESLLALPPARRRALLGAVAAAGIDHVCVGDHISFHGGTGFHGLISATSVLSSHDELPVIVGVVPAGRRSGR